MSTCIVVVWHSLIIRQKLQVRACDAAAIRKDLPRLYQKMSIALGLGRIQRLLECLSSPHLQVPIVHIAGTNGKGSVSAYLDSILRRSGVRTARFNSPHLLTVNDSILINGTPVSAETYNARRRKVEAADAEHGVGASPFELLTATAFECFADHQPKVDVALIEVGMGGAEDATNVVPDPLLAIITSVDFDHQEFLGNSIEAIAGAKCGIFKRGCPCLIGPQRHASVLSVATRRSRELGAPSFYQESSRLDRDKRTLNLGVDGVADISVPQSNALLSQAQADNAGIAARAATMLKMAQSSATFAGVTSETVVQGISATKWLGRLDRVEWGSALARMPVLVDGAHNVASAQALSDYLAAELDGSEAILLIVALSGTKDAKAFLSALLGSLPSGSRVSLIATALSGGVDGMPWVQSVDAELIAQAGRAVGIPEVEIAANLPEALRVAEQWAADHPKRVGGKEIVVTGSLYLVSELYRLCVAERQTT